MTKGEVGAPFVLCGTYKPQGVKVPNTNSTLCVQNEYASMDVLGKANTSLRAAHNA